MRPIDADAMLEENGYCTTFRKNLYLCDDEDIKEWLDEQPTLDVVPVRHGRWIAAYREICSTCKTQFDDDMFWIQGEFIAPNYCPNCGAKMDLKE